MYADDVDPKFVLDRLPRNLNFTPCFAWPRRFSWSTVVSSLREYAESLEANGQPTPFELKQRPDGQWVSHARPSCVESIADAAIVSLVEIVSRWMQVADVFPLALESMMFGNWQGEVWIEPGKPPTQVCLQLRCLWYMCSSMMSNSGNLCGACERHVVLQGRLYRQDGGRHAQATINGVALVLGAGESQTLVSVV